MVNLKAKPYYLSDEDIAWVENTIAGMSAEERKPDVRAFVDGIQVDSYVKED